MKRISDKVLRDGWMEAGREEGRQAGRKENTTFRNFSANSDLRTECQNLPECLAQSWKRHWHLYMVPRTN